MKFLIDTVINNTTAREKSVQMNSNERTGEDCDDTWPQTTSMTEREYQ